MFFRIPPPPVLFENDTICGNCAFWLEFGDQSIGSCKRYPPVYTQENEDFIDAYKDRQTRIVSRQVVPHVSGKDCCGEWKKLK